MATIYSRKTEVIELRTAIFLKLKPETNCLLITVLGFYSGGLAEEEKCIGTPSDLGWFMVAFEIAGKTMTL